MSEVADMSPTAESNRTISAKKRSFGAISDDNVSSPSSGGKPETVSGTEGAAGPGTALIRRGQSPGAGKGAACKGCAPCASHPRFCRIVDTDSICLDANLSDEDFKWPNDRTRSKGRCVRPWILACTPCVDISI